MAERFFNLYELIHEIYLAKYIGALKPYQKIISKDELDQKFYQIPSKGKANALPIVILVEEMRRAERELNISPTRYMLFERVKNQEYVIIPENDVLGCWTQILSADNTQGNMKLVSLEIDAKRRKRSYNARRVSKSQLDQKTGLTFEVFKKRFERHIKVLLDDIFEMSDALHMFKENETYRFTISDCRIFRVLYDSYDKQGKYLIRQEYEKITPSYIEFLLHSINIMIEQHHFDIALDPIKEKLNVILLKAQKNQLKSDLLQLEELIQQITNIAEDSCIEEKINLIQAHHDYIMNCYQDLLSASKKYLS